MHSVLVLRFGFSSTSRENHNLRNTRHHQFIGDAYCNIILHSFAQASSCNGFGPFGKVVSHSVRQCPSPSPVTIDLLSLPFLSLSSLSMKIFSLSLQIRWNLYKLWEMMFCWGGVWKRLMEFFLCFFRIVEYNWVHIRKTLLHMCWILSVTPCRA